MEEFTRLREEFERLGRVAVPPPSGNSEETTPVEVHPHVFLFPFSHFSDFLRVPPPSLRITGECVFLRSNARKLILSSLTDSRELREACSRLYRRRILHLKTRRNRKEGSRRFTYSTPLRTQISEKFVSLLFSDSKRSVQQCLPCCAQFG